MDFFKLHRYKLLFSLLFVGYFFFFQIVARLFIITNISFPQGVNVVISTSTPVPPQEMPFPLWGPYLSITTPHFSWAMTPLSIGISAILSLLVALNITLYVIYYVVMKFRATQSLIASLGLIATSLSCSCEFFTALIGSAVANLPLVISTAFMERVFETLVVLAIALLSLSTYVLYSEIKGKEVLRGLGGGYGTYLIVTISILASLILPEQVYLSFVRLVLGIIAGVGISSIIKKKWKPGIFISFALTIAILSTFNFLYRTPEILVPLSVITGILANMGFSTLKSWAKLGILHVIAWTLIMPGPISLLLGQPIPFFNFPPTQLIYLWVTTWIVGTPIAWYAGVYYLQYLRSKTAIKEVPKIVLPKVKSRDLGLEWIIAGTFMLVVQTLYFLTHVPYYVDYNGYDLKFLFLMTSLSTVVMVVGSIALGYGISKLIKGLFGIPRPRNWLKWSSIFAVFFALLSGVVHIGVSGYPYPPVLFGLFGIPLFEPSVTIYIPHIIGAYIYPLQVLQLISSSLMAGAIVSYSLESKSKKGSIVSVLGPIAVCPMCTLSSFSAYYLGVIGIALAGTYITNFINSLEGQLLLSFLSQAVLLAFVIFYGRRVKISLKPKTLTLRLNGKV